MLTALLHCWMQFCATLNSALLVMGSLQQIKCFFFSKERFKNIVHVKVAFYELVSVGPIFGFILSCCPSEPVDSHCRGRHISEYVDIHPLSYNVLSKSLKPQIVPVVLPHCETMKHLLDICCYCDWLYQDTQETVVRVRNLLGGHC